MALHVRHTSRNISEPSFAMQPATKFENYRPFRFTENRDGEVSFCDLYVELRIAMTRSK